MGARRLRVRECAPMRGSGESGGAAVEAAIILPAMLVLLLCAIQIAQLQQARVMAEYAAFNAARAGIVQNGNNGADGTSGPMHDAAVLSIQVRYLYELRVPFANKLLQTIWLASHVGLGRARALEGWTGWDLSSPKAVVPGGPDAVALTRALALGGQVEDGTPDGISLGALALAGNQGRYFLPIQAWYTMRLQSNPFAKWAAP